MSVQETIIHTLGQLHIADLLSFDDFAAVIRNDEMYADVSTEALEAYYDVYKEDAISNKEEFQKRTDHLVEDLRRNSMNEIVAGEQSNFFSLEDIINTLYKVGLLLETRTNVINETLEDRTEVLKRFEEGTQLSTISNDSITEILNTLGVYKRLLQEADN